MMAEAPPNYASIESDKSRILCGANVCFSKAELECPICKLCVCKKHQHHDNQFDKEAVKAHSTI